MNIVHIHTTSDQVDNLPVVDGQLIVLDDVSRFYYDMNGVRHNVTSGDGITIDTALSSTSRNPVENRVITSALGDKADTSALGSAAFKDAPATGDAATTEVVMGDDSRLSDARPASDVYSWAKAETKPSYTAAEVGAIPSTAKGANSGVAELDENGKVPTSQLPSYVDDVLEYSSQSEFPATGETGKIYVDTTTNLTYRWSGSAYVEISPSLALGETSSTAYRGDRGKTAYDHSQLTSGNPHNVTAADVGLGDVGNFKAVSTVASQGLTDTEKSNARANIGAGTSSLTIGTGASNAAAGNHTHGLSLATDSGTSSITLAASTKYKLTAGGSTYVFTTPPNTTYANVSTSAAGLAPKVTDTSKYLKGDGTWATPTNTTYATFSTAANGLTPAPASGSTGKFLRGDGTWQTPTNTTYANVSTSAAGLAPKVTSTSAFLKGDGTWATPTNTTYATVSTSAAGLAPKVTSTSGFLKGDGTWSTPANTTYSAGSNITLSGTTFSLTKANVTGALGYTPPTTNTTYANMSTAAAGLAPKVTDTSKYLRGDGTWQTPTNTTYAVVSTSANGLAPKVTSTSAFLKGDGTWATPTNTTYAVVSASANGLAPKVTDTSKYLKGDGTWATPTDTNNRRGFWGTCATAAATAEKAVTLGSTAGWELVAGTIVGVKFTNTNTAGTVKLNVNSSGAKQIWYSGAAYTGTEARITGWAGHTIYYMYDGTYWEFLNNDANYINTNTTYTGSNGVSLSGTTFSNSGVRSIATGTSNGTINVNTNGSTANVSVKGLGTAAYTASTAYASSGHTHTLSMAADSGTSSITLAASTKYKLTAGGSTYIFTTPPNSTYSVGNATLTIQKNGTTVKTFTANATSNVTANITTDTWTSTAAVTSSGTVAFSSLNDNYGYDLYCQNKLISIKSIAKSGSGTSTKLTYTLSGAATGDVCKLRVLI